MAKVYTLDELKALKKFDLPKGYQRTSEFPMDPSSLFASKADAELYAAGGADARGLGATSYAGQVIGVVEGGVVTIYKINVDGTISALGADSASDISSLGERVDDVESAIEVLNGDEETEGSVAKAIADAIAELPADMVVSGGSVEEREGVLSLVLTIAGGDEVVIPATELVDTYTGDDEYISVENYKVSLDIDALKTALAEVFASKDDIADFITEDALEPYAKQEDLNTVSGVASGAASKAEANETAIAGLSDRMDDAEDAVEALQALVGSEAEGEEGEDGYKPASGLVAQISAIADANSDNATAAENAQAAADAAQNAIDALIAVVGTPSDGDGAEPATGLVARIEALENNTDAADAAEAAAEAAAAAQDDIDELNEKLGDVDALVAKVNSVAEGAQVNVIEGVKVNNKEASIEDKVASVSLDAADIKLNAAIGENLYTTDSTVQSVLSAYNDRLDAINTSVESALEGGVTSINAGVAISVATTGGDASKTAPKVGVKLAQNSALGVNSSNELDLFWIEEE